MSITQNKDDIKYYVNHHSEKGETVLQVQVIAASMFSKQPQGANSSNFGIVQYVTNSQKQPLISDRFYGTTLTLPTVQDRQGHRRTSPSSNPNLVTEQLASKGQTDSFPIWNCGFSSLIFGIKEDKILLLDSRLSDQPTKRPLKARSEYNGTTILHCMLA